MKPEADAPVPQPLTLDWINAAAPDAVRAALDGLYEHSPWVVETALSTRPFGSLAELKRELAEAVRHAGLERQLALIRAHPELAGRAMVAGTLTRDSTNEQSTSGLTHCSPDELQTLQALNAQYNARFGWPFVLAVRGPSGRGLTRTEIIDTLRRRLGSDAPDERDECLRQIDRIAEIRLHDRLGLPAAAESATQAASGTATPTGLAERPIRFFHRGRIVEVEGVHPTLSVLDWLREHARCTGTKEGCNEGDCGACTVVIGELPERTDDPSAAVRGLVLRSVNACLQFLPTLDGRALFTVEDLQAIAGDALHPVQQALVECHGSQCGFCTPGFVMSLYAQYERHGAAGTRPTRQQLADGLAGNLCRCTGYRPILDAGERQFELPPVRLDTAPVIEALRVLHREPALDHRAPNRHRPLAAPADSASASTRACDRDRAPCGDGRIDRFMAPRTLPALAALRLAQPAARLLAGSTDIGLWVTKQFVDVGDLLYVGQVDELKRIEVRAAPHSADVPEGPADELWIGAGVSLDTAWRTLAGRWPALAEVGLRFAGPPVRHAGTMGGNVANGSPIGDGAPLLMALGAQIELRRGEAVRRLALDDFYTGYKTSRLQPGEFVQALAVPLGGAPHPSVRRAVRAYKISKRFDCDISALCGAFAIEFERSTRASNAESNAGSGDGDVVRTVRLAFGGLAATVRRAAAAEAALIGRPWTAESVALAQRALADDFQPLSDLRASAGYRLQVAGNLIRRFWLETRTVDPLSSAQSTVWPLRAVTGTEGPLPPTHGARPGADR